jgi:hypothetical protein
MGNNEAVGFYAPEPGQFNLTAHPRLIRLVQWLKSTKLAQLFVNASRALRKQSPKREKQDMEFFRKRLLSAHDPLRRTVIENFRANLSEILQVARGSGGRTILSTVGVNLLDFPPLGSVHRQGLSAEETARWETAYKEGIAEESGWLHPGHSTLRKGRAD